MSGESRQLPWDELQRAEGGIPWSALHALADAVVTDRRVAQKLFELYDRAYEQAPDQGGYADFYAAAVLALAAPRLDDERRLRSGPF